MPVEIYVGSTRLEEVSPETRLALGQRLTEASRRTLQAWVNENVDKLRQEAQKGA